MIPKGNYFLWMANFTGGVSAFVELNKYMSLIGEFRIGE
jgi:hypothetical protein